MNRFSSAVGAADRLLAHVAMAFIVALALLVSTDVVLRYLFNQPLSWGVDVSRYLLSAIFYLGLAPTLQLGRHVSIDVSDEIFPLGIRRVLGHVARFAVVVFAAIFLYYTARHFLSYFRSGDVTANLLAIPVWWTYVFAPIGVALFFLTAVAQLLDPTTPAPRD